MMKVLNWIEIVGQAVKAEQKFAVFVSNQLDLSKEEDKEIWMTIVDRITKLYGSGTDKYSKTFNHLVEDEYLVFFDTKEEQLKFFEIFNSDPVYSSAVYACTFSPNGNCTDENT